MIEEPDLKSVAKEDVKIGESYLVKSFPGYEIGVLEMIDGERLWLRLWAEWESPNSKGSLYDFTLDQLKTFKGYNEV